MSPGPGTAASASEVPGGPGKPMRTPAPLDPAAIALLLRSSAAAIAGEVRAAPRDALAWHPEPDAWCVQEVLGHLIEADRRGFAGRIRVLIDRDSPDLVGWDQQEVARSRRDCERDADELLQEYLSQRDGGLPLLERLSPADLARGGRHPKVGWLTAGEVVHEWVHHDRNHLRQLLANIQEYVWPHLGAAQGFRGE